MLSTMPPSGHIEFPIHDAYTALYLPTTNLDPRCNISCQSTKSAHTSREEDATGCSTTVTSLISVTQAECGRSIKGAQDQYIDRGGHREILADVHRTNMDRNVEICDVSLPARTAILSGHGRLNQSEEPRRCLSNWSTEPTKFLSDDEQVELAKQLLHFHGVLEMNAEIGTDSNRSTLQDGSDCWASDQGITPITSHGDQAREGMDRNAVDHSTRSCAPAHMATREDSSNVDKLKGDYDEDDDVHNGLSREPEPELSMEVHIDEESGFERAYKQIFRFLQELSMKEILKKWIKEIEPKKSHRLPYHAGRGLPPEWWPDKVEHREPEHLKKEPRQILAIAILRYAMTKDFKQRGIERLKQSTTGVKLQFATDSDQKRAGREKLLDQLYDVARREEAYISSATLMINLLRPRNPREKPRRRDDKHKSRRRYPQSSQASVPNLANPACSACLLSSQPELTCDASSPLPHDLSTQLQEHQDRVQCLRDDTDTADNDAGATNTSELSWSLPFSDFTQALPAFTPYRAAFMPSQQVPIWSSSWPLQPLSSGGSTQIIERDATIPMSMNIVPFVAPPTSDIAPAAEAEAMVNMPALNGCPYDNRFRPVPVAMGHLQS